MKIFISSFIFLILVSCGGDAGNVSASASPPPSASPQPSYNKDTFFECELINANRGTYANITYNAETNSASFDSDFMDTGMGIIYEPFSIKKTADELIMEVDLGMNFLAEFRLNRKSLVLSGTRDGECKIVEKDLAF